MHLHSELEVLGRFPASLPISAWPGTQCKCDIPTVHNLEVSATSEWAADPHVQRYVSTSKLWQTTLIEPRQLATKSEVHHKLAYKRVVCVLRSSIFGSELMEIYSHSESSHPICARPSPRRDSIIYRPS